jgi:hypothetical protein
MAKKPTPPISFPREKAEKPKPSKRVTVARPGSKEARAIAGKSEAKLIGLSAPADSENTPQHKQNKRDGFTTNVRTHGAPKYVSNSLGKGTQTIRPSDSQLESHQSAGAEASRSAELPHGKNNPIFTAGSPEQKAANAHLDDPMAKSTSPLLREKYRKMADLTHKFVSSTKPAEKEAHRAAFHALSGGKRTNGISGPCSTGGCTRTTDSNTGSCEGGKCNVETPASVGARPRG